MPSSWILRVSVLRPHPSQRRRIHPVPAGVRKRAADQRALEFLLQPVADAALAVRERLRELAVERPLPARFGVLSTPAPRAPRALPAADRRPRCADPDAITVSQWQMFSSWRTLPGNAKAASTLHRSVGKRLGLDREIARALVQEVARERRNVLDALAQRRQSQPHDVEAVQQVLAEQALAHALLEVLVRRGDDAHRRALRRVAADAVVLAVGEHAQQPHLQVGRHVADFVEEQRAAFGLLEAPAPHAPARR